MRLLKRGISMLLIFAIMLSLLSVSSFAFGEHKQYTVMVYMVGSDLESSLTGGCASTDITEMITSGVDFENTNVIVYTGGSNRWHLDIPNNKNSVLELNSSGYDIVASTNANVNMAESATMADFLQFTYNNYPADHYSLICWDHGGGPMMGFGSDEIFGGDLLTIQELETALSVSPFGPGNKLDWIGFDACLMGSLEIAEAVSDYADYFVASEESEPGCGWGYSFLASLNFTTDPISICKSIVDAYGPHTSDYENLHQYDFDCTLSCMDLSQVDATIAAMEPLWSAMTTDLHNGMFSSIAQFRNLTKEFTDGFDLVDLNDLAEEMSMMYPTQASALQSQIQNLIIHDYSDISDTAGVSIYYPYNNMDYYLYEWGYTASGMMDGASNYYGFLEAFVSEWAAASSRSSFQTRSLLSTDAEDEFTMQLTQDQVDNLAGAYYTILKLDEDNGGYYPLLMNVALEPDAENVLHVSYDQDIFCCYTEDPENGVEWKVSQEKVETGRTVYSTQNTKLYGSNEFNYYFGAPSENISIDFYCKDGSSDTVLMNVSIDNGELATLGKNDISVDGWGSIGYSTGYHLTPTYDTDGTLLPYEEWESNGWIGSVSSTLSDSFYFEKLPLSQCDGEFICQIILEDVSGNIYGSDLVTFPKNDEPETTAVKTAHGEITFSLYGDHAELTEYAGTDETLELPSEVQGLPVTVISEFAFFHQNPDAAVSPSNDNDTLKSVTIPGSVERIENGAFINMKALETVQFNSGLQVIGYNAFSRCSNLKEIILPDTLVSLDSYAFADCYQIETVTLPATLNHVGIGAFAGNRGMTAFTLDDKNTYYTLVDGVLFNADKTELVSYPGNHGQEYTVPEGVTVIRPFAFSGAGDLLTTINFSSTLEKIGYYAFYGCAQLEALSFPDSLVSIGNAAFYCSVWDTTPELPVHIGANLQEIGISAFTGIAGTFTVSDSSSYYSCIDGFLLNKQGDTLLICPNGKFGSVTIPEGVVTISAEAFENCDNITELIFPDSLVTIDSRSGVPYDLVSVTIGKNLTNWENFSWYSDVAEFNISDENPVYTMVDGVLYTADMKQMLLYPNSKFAESYTVPEGVVTISGAFNGNTFLKELVLPSTLTSLPDSNGYTQLSSLDNLESISFGSKHSTMTVEDGLVYEDDVLLFCPNAITGTVTVREGTTTIGKGAFGWNMQAAEVVLPESVKWIQADNFCNTRNFDYNLSDTPMELYLPASVKQISDEAFGYEPIINIHCTEGSYAASFAAGKGLTIVTE